MNRKNRLQLIAVCLSLLAITPLRSQISVVSTDGYAVNISIVPKQIVPTSSSCLWGYNYNVTLDYVITFTGSNRPASLYTLQGYLGCGLTMHFFDLPNNPATGSTTSTSNQWTALTNCLTSTVTSMGCNLATIEISGPGIAYRLVTFVVQNSILPVRLVDFSATVAAAGVYLSWATESEESSSTFRVERSIDGQAWTELGSLPAGGNSVSRLSYHFLDGDPVAGASYYRVKEIDMDGSVLYSPVAAVKVQETNGQLHISPVPNRGRAITITGMTDYRHSRLSATGMTGVKVFEMAITSSNVTLPVLAPGMYFMQVENVLTGEKAVLRYVQE